MRDPRAGTGQLCLGTGVMLGWGQGQGVASRDQGTQVGKSNRPKKGLDVTNGPHSEPLQIPEGGGDRRQGSSQSPHKRRHCGDLLCPWVHAEVGTQPCWREPGVTGPTWVVAVQASGGR